MTATFFANPSEFRKWLEQNHKTATELIVGYYKVNSGKPSMSWSESVDQALCFGWIDGVRRSIDNESYCIRFTPRRKNSIWSAININKVEVLTKAGLMKPEGLEAYSHKTDHKTKIYSHEKEPSVLDPEFLTLFKENKKAWSYFVAQPPSYQKVMTHWIMSAKQVKTRQMRLHKTIEISEKQKRME